MALNTYWTESVPCRDNIINGHGGFAMIRQLLKKDEIERRAYAIYLIRGAQDGDDVTDWLMAEQELIREATQQDDSKARLKREATAA
jgi:Protein of unknown function (DUF2934)